MNHPGYHYWLQEHYTNTPAPHFEPQIQQPSWQELLCLFPSQTCRKMITTKNLRQEKKKKKLPCRKNPLLLNANGKIRLLEINNDHDSAIATATGSNKKRSAPRFVSPPSHHHNGATSSSFTEKNKGNDDHDRDDDAGSTSSKSSTASSTSSTSRTNSVIMFIDLTKQYSDDDDDDDDNNEIEKDERKGNQDAGALVSTTVAADTQTESFNTTNSSDLAGQPTADTSTTKPASLAAAAAVSSSPTMDSNINDKEPPRDLQSAPP